MQSRYSYFLLVASVLLALRSTESFQASSVQVRQQQQQQHRPTRRGTAVVVVGSSPTGSDTAFSQQRVVSTVEDATEILTEWDKGYNPESASASASSSQEGKLTDLNTIRPLLPTAVHVLNHAAAAERLRDSTKGRCMLGICASSAQEGVAALKSWVTNLQLPRGLLHGMDKDGVPIDLDGGVYIKYNTGGVLTFSDIRKLGMGFDAIWKPGDALLEPYDGAFRGVYFQVELSDGVFRQFLVPLDIFGSE